VLIDGSALTRAAVIALDTVPSLHSGHRSPAAAALSSYSATLVNHSSKTCPFAQRKS
jgi:hypothetical protein